MFRLNETNAKFAIDFHTNKYRNKVKKNIFSKTPYR